MENVLFMNIDSEESEATVGSFDSSATPDVFPRQFFVFVPPTLSVINGKTVSGKIVSWVASDPDSEDDLVFNKDFRLAFEFKDYDHAKRAKDLISITMDTDALIFGEMQ